MSYIRKDEIGINEAARVLDTTREGVKRMVEDRGLPCRETDTGMFFAYSEIVRWAFTGGSDATSLPTPAVQKAAATTPEERLQKRIDEFVKIGNQWLGIACDDILRLKTLRNGNYSSTAEQRSAILKKITDVLEEVRCEFERPEGKRRVKLTRAERIASHAVLS